MEEGREQQEHAKWGYLGPRTYSTTQVSANSAARIDGQPIITRHRLAEIDEVYKQRLSDVVETSVYYGRGLHYLCRYCAHYDDLRGVRNWTDSDPFIDGHEYGLGHERCAIEAQLQHDRQVDSGAARLSNFKQAVSSCTPAGGTACPQGFRLESVCVCVCVCVCV
jgi:hypothetical protein